jgi:tRNA pseudouridine38-40 synthase
MRYFIKLAYNGKNYHGWQIQPNATSVQGEIQEKLSILLKQNTEIVGCGRTDTGVHAKVYFAHFENQEALDTEKFCHQLNAILPKAIVIYEVFLVQDQMHARFNALERAYEYVIATEPNPFTHELSWFVPKKLDVEAMNQAAQLLLTHKDFECFSKVHTDVKTFLCDIRYAHWEMNANKELVFTVKADRFLRNMVRAIVGTLVEVGKGKVTLSDFKQILESKNRSEAGQSVPAHGLFLSDVKYAF